MLRARKLVPVIVAIAMLGAACGDDAPETTPQTTSSATVPSEVPSTEPTQTTETVETADVPQRIVSLSPSATEMLFAIGAGDQVLAVDAFSYFPPEAPVTELSGFQPNVEAIVGYDPDLVVLSDDIDDVVSGLQAAGITTMLMNAPVDIPGTYAQIEQLGEATGHTAEATDLVEQMQTTIDRLIASIPERETPLTYYHELDDQLYSVTSKTFIGEIYALAGLTNVADAADPDGAAGGYPQLSAEYLVDADPDLIFLADTVCCAQSAASLAARPGFDQLSAVKAGNVIELDDDIASRWGPRIVDFLETVVAATNAASAADTGTS